MDTMFTLPYHHQSFTSTITTSGSSSKSSTDHHQPPQQCFFMEEDIQYSTTPTSTTTPPPNKSQDDVVMEFSGTLSTTGWASEILSEAARATVDNNNNNKSSRLQQLMWMLNELGSPYGDIDEKLSYYFLQAFFCRMTDSGDSTHRTLTSVNEQTCTFETTRNLTLKFQEVSPWTTFGHVAANAAIMEAFDGETKLHIVDISNTFCTQWPTLLETIATRTDDTPHLRLTVIIVNGKSDGNNGMETVMGEIGSRMGKFARLMGVPFKFNVVHHTGDLSYLNFGELDIKSDECLAVNLNGTLRSVSVHRRNHLLSVIRTMKPKIVTIVEEEAELDIGTDGIEFLRGFQECLRWFRVYLEALSESFPRTSNERLMLEREAGRAVMDLVARRPEYSVERRETADRWWSRLRGNGFECVSFNEEGCEDVRALVRRYKEGWSMLPSDTGAGIFLMRKETPVVWASAWKAV